MHVPSDHLLVDAALLGSREAFEALYDRYADVVYGSAFSRIGDADTAESITQDVFEALWDSLEKVSLGTGSILPWLETAVRYRCEHAKTKVGRTLVTVDIAEYELTHVDEDGMESRIDAQDLLRRIEREVATMSPLDVAVFQHLIRDGLSYEETAALLGVRAGAVRTRMSRIRTTLRQRFEGEGL